MGIAAFLFKDYRVGFFIMLIIASIFYILFLIGLYYDYHDARRKDRKEKQESSHKALAESFRRARPEWIDEQVETAATGDTKPYQPIDGEEDWVSPREAYNKSR